MGIFITKLKYFGKKILFVNGQIIKQIREKLKIILKKTIVWQRI
jgi:hypothetical protein